MTKAVTLAELADQNVLSVDGANNRVGIASTQPTATLDVAGIVSATSYYGDGSNLEGVSSAGLGTAVEAGSAFGGEQIYYTNTVLSIGGTVTVDPPSSSNIAYTQYQEIAVESGADLIVGDGDDLVFDILGLSTEGIGALPGAGGRVRADSFTNKAGTGAPTFQTGLQVTGVVTATGSIQVGSGQSFGSSGASAAVYYGDGSNLTGVSAGLAASTITLQTWLFGGG